MTTARKLVAELAAQAAIQEALAAAKALAPSVINEAVLLQQIPAPTFDEARRASYVRQRFEDGGLSDVLTDDLHVVYARLPGSDPDAPAVMVSAHLDTVFPLDTVLNVRRRGKRLFGPGLGDNSVSVAAMLALPPLLQIDGFQPPADIWLVGTVGEEGLGDLCGMQRAVERLADRVGLVVVVEGMALGHIFHHGLGVRRLKVEVNGPGGHSWLNHGRPSAVHALLKLGAVLTDIPVPSGAPSSLNIGLIEGGLSINTIAPHASLSIDLRSEDAAALDKLEGRVMAAIERFDFPAEITCGVEVIGNRPAGKLPRAHPLVAASEAVLRTVGVSPVAYRAASTDANVPLSRNLAAVCIGITTGGNAHRLDEYIDTEPVGTGLQQLLLLSLAAAHHSREWAAWDNVG